MPEMRPDLSAVRLPADTDYIGIYLTNKCFLNCPYCITNQANAFINARTYRELSPEEWTAGLNRLTLPPDIPVTFEGGEPFLYKGIWTLLQGVRHKIDILTALPPQVTPERFKDLTTLEWNRRPSPYPTIRVSYHHGQNDYHELIGRIRELQDVVSIGLYHIEHPDYPDLTEEIRKEAKQAGVTFRTKAFLGEWNGKLYGQYKYPDACAGKPARPHVRCRNTVFPIAPNGDVYRCHSDLYTGYAGGVTANLMDPDLKMEFCHRDCDHYGTCSPCDVKVKTNHLQQFGYTSIDVKFDET